MSKWKRSLILALFVFGSVPLATADVLYDSFWNETGYDSTEPSSAAYGPDSGNEVKTAYQFTLHSGQDYYLTTIDIAILVDSGTVPGITVSLCGDDNDEISAVMETIAITSLPTGTDVIVTASFSGNTTMTGGETYWVMFEGIGDSKVNLLENWMGMYAEHAFQPAGYSWMYNYIPAPGMRLEGAPVPEPTSLFLLSVGGSALLRRKGR